MKIPLDGNVFVIKTDASHDVIAGVLSIIRENEKYPVEFFGKTLNKTEQNWSTTNKEAFAIILSVKKFDRFIRGRDVTILTDHENLQWIFKSTKSRVYRWSLILGEFPMKVLYMRGADNVVVDFLTRQVDAEYDFLDNRLKCFCSEILVEESLVPTIQEVREAQKNEKAESYLPQKGYTIYKGLIYYHNLLYCPVVLRGKVIRKCHLQPPINHPGQKKTIRMINRVFNWPRAYENVRRYIQGCIICQKTRIGKEIVQGIMKTHPIRQIMHTIYMDFYSVTFHGKQVKLLTMIDQFSKMGGSS